MRNHDLIETVVLAAIALGFAAASFALSGVASADRHHGPAEPGVVSESAAW